MKAGEVQYQTIDSPAEGEQYARAWAARERGKVSADQRNGSYQRDEMSLPLLYNGLVFSLLYGSRKMGSKPVPAACVREPDFVNQFGEVQRGRVIEWQTTYKERTSGDKGCREYAAHKLMLLMVKHSSGSLIPG